MLCLCQSPLCFLWHTDKMSPLVNGHKENAKWHFLCSDDVSGVGTQLVCLVLNESTSIILKQVIERLR